SGGGNSRPGVTTRFVCTCTSRKRRGGRRHDRPDVAHLGDGHAHAPLIITSWTTRLTPAARIGSHSTSFPTAATSFSIFWIVEAIVNSRTGPASAPRSI